MSINEGAPAPSSPNPMPAASASDTGYGRWSLTLRLLHWTTVPLLAVQLAVSFTLMGDGSGTMAWLTFHVSLGALLVVVIGARLLCRIFDRGPHGRRFVAQLMQAVLYLACLGVSVTGWFAYRPSPFAARVSLFGYADLPILMWSRLAPWPLWHQWLAWLLILLVTGHIALAIYHTLTPGDQVMRSMCLRVGRKRSHSGGTQA